MSKMQHLQGSILTPQGWVDGEITFTDRIENVRAGDAATSGKTYILPGFIDLHVHGAGGKDTMEAGDAVSVIARRHALHGTTSMLATTMTAPLGDIEAALNAMADVIHQRPQGAARVLGVHLEGPYINPGKLGAQPDFAGQGDIKQVLALNALAPIRLITIAPEMPGHMELISQLVDAGMLETWLLESASARQLGLEPTGHASRGIGGAPGGHLDEQCAMAALDKVKQRVDLWLGQHVGKLLGPLQQLEKGEGLEGVTRGVAFLVADEGAFITGSTLSINGGQHMY